MASLPLVSHPKSCTKFILGWSMGKLINQLKKNYGQHFFLVPPWQHTHDSSRTHLRPQDQRAATKKVNTHTTAHFLFCPHRTHSQCEEKKPLPFRSGSASPVSAVPDPGMLNAMIRQGAPSMELFWVKTWVLTSPTYSSAARALFLRRPVCVWSLPPRSEWIH